MWERIPHLMQQHKKPEERVRLINIQQIHDKINSLIQKLQKKKKIERTRRRLFPFRKQAMPFLTVDAIIGNQAFSIADVIVCSGLCCNKVISNFFKSS